MKRKKSVVLLIEDELFIRELYQNRLQKSGFSVLVASDGMEGFNLASKNPDIILLDIMLPKMNGMEVLAKLKNNSQTSIIPVVMLTNLGQESIIKEAFKNGCLGYIMKMRVTPSELSQRVEEFLANPTQKMDVAKIDLD